MSEQQAGQDDGTCGLTNVESAVPAASETAGEPTAVAQGLASEFSFADADGVVAAREASATPADARPADLPKAEIAAPAASLGTAAEAPQVEMHQPEATVAAGNVIVMPPRDRGFGGDGAAKQADDKSIFGQRRIAAVGAAVMIAAISGAIGGAMATAAFMQGGSPAFAANDGQGPLEASLARIDTDLQALKAGLEHTSRLGMNQFSKASDRLDKLERAQAEPAAKLAKLSDAVDRLHAVAPAATVVPASATPAKEITASVPPAPTMPATAQQPGSTVPKTEVARLPTLEDWVLRDVDRGSAWIGSGRRVYEVYAGDFIPGLGRIDAIRRQDGRWVVVTSRGLIVAR